MLRVGVIGAGLVFQNAHGQAYERRDDVRVVCVADPNEAYRTQVGARLGCATLYDDYRRVLDHAAVDAVDICLPHYLHEEAVLAAFDAGKHVLLEKPIACTLESADRMIAAAARHGLQFHVALNQRFYPAHQRTKSMLESGAHGRPFFAVAHVFAYASANPVATLVSLVVVFVLSLVLGTIYERTDKLTVAAFVHGTYNAVLFGLLYVALVYGPEIESAASQAGSLVP